MGITCILKGHDWQKGKCRRCGEAHQEHEWETIRDADCIAMACCVCGATMQWTHQWERVSGQYKEKCAYCGKERSVAPPPPPPPDVSQITDPEKLKKIAADYACNWIGTQEDFETACKSIKDQMLLAELFCLIENPREREAEFIAALITEPKAVKYASRKSHYYRLLSDKLDELRIAKLREKSPGAIAEIAKSDTSPRVRAAAAKLLRAVSGQGEEAETPVVAAASAPIIPKDSFVCDCCGKALPLEKMMQDYKVEICLDCACRLEQRGGHRVYRKRLPDVQGYSYVCVRCGQSEDWEYAERQGPPLSELPCQ